MRRLGVEVSPQAQHDERRGGAAGGELAQPGHEGPPLVFVRAQREDFLKLIDDQDDPVIRHLLLAAQLVVLSGQLGERVGGGGEDGERPAGGTRRRQAPAADGRH